MAVAALVEPVKYFVAVLSRAGADLATTFTRLSADFGDLDFHGGEHLFDSTDYYAAEMGPDLVRRIVSFQPLRDPGLLAADKLFCNDLETALADHGRRTVNLDLGYLDHNKIVLASLKPAGQKIYLARGVYADLAARYRGGRYESFPWSFPDFRDQRYQAEWAFLRRQYLDQLRQWRRSAAPGA